MSRRLKRLIASVLACITMFTAIDYSAFASGEDSMGIGNEYGYYLDGTPVKSPTSTWAIKPGTSMTTWDKVQNMFKGRVSINCITNMT